MTLDLSSPELRFALNAVQGAARLAQRIQTGMTIMGLTKSDLSPVTVADYAGQALIAKALAEAFPKDPLVAEEGLDDLASDAGRAIRDALVDFVCRVEPDATEASILDWIGRGQGEPKGRFWTLDPIDGTKGYLRGGQYAVALALLEDNEVKLGVLACPNLGPGCSLETSGEGIVAAALRGQGAGWAPMEALEDFHELRVSTCADPAEACILRSFESGHTNTAHLEELCKDLASKRDPLLMDSQAKYASLAAGHAEVMVRFLSPADTEYREKIWDQAAGSIVLEEAGGRMTDLSGKPLDFAHGRTLAQNRGICASNGLLHDRVLSAISALS